MYNKNHKPLINSNPVENFIFSVLRNESEILNSYLINNYILTYQKYVASWKDYQFSFVDSSNMKFINSDAFKTLRINNENIKDYRSFSCILKNLLKSNYTLIMNVDILYIKNYNSDIHRSHEAIICDYESSTNKVTIGDYFSTSTFRYEMCDVEELYKAFMEYKKHIKKDNAITAIKVNKNYSTYSLSDLKFQLKSFINSFFSPLNDNFGIAMFHCIISYFKLKKNFLNPKTLLYKLNFLKNHIFLMKMRINYLKKKGDLISDFNGIDILFHNISIVENKCMKIVLRNRKYYTKEENIFFIKKLNRISNQYKGIIIKLIKSIELIEKNTKKEREY